MVLMQNITGSRVCGKAAIFIPKLYQGTGKDLRLSVSTVGVTNLHATKKSRFPFELK